MTSVPAPPTAEERRASYQRGKILTALVVFVTAATYLVPAIGELFSKHATHRWQDFLTGPILFGLICWAALRGGGFSTGCLTILYTVFLSIILMVSGIIALAFLVPEAFTAEDGSHPKLTLDWQHPPSLPDTLPLLALVVWIGFSFWVLVFSRDARYYRLWRQRGVRSAADPSFDDWRPGPPVLPLPPPAR